MTDHTHPEPIRLVVQKTEHGTFAIVPAMVAQQIVVVGSGVIPLHAEFEKRIAALEVIAKHSVYVVPPLSDKAREGLRSASGGRPIPVQPMNTDPAAWAQWAAKSGAQPVEATPPATDDAAEDDEIPEDLARAINDARDGRAPTHEQVGVMLHYLVAGTAELEQARRERADLAVAVQEYGRQRDAAIARAERAERELDEARGQVAHQDALVSEFSARANAALARAEKAERENASEPTRDMLIQQLKHVAVARREDQDRMVEIVLQRDEARAEAEKLAGLLLRIKSSCNDHLEPSSLPSDIMGAIDAALAARKEGGK